MRNIVDAMCILLVLNLDGESRSLHFLFEKVLYPLNQRDQKREQGYLYLHREPNITKFKVLGLNRQDITSKEYYILDGGVIRSLTSCLQFMPSTGDYVERRGIHINSNVYIYTHIFAQGVGARPLGPWGPMGAQNVK